MAVGFPFSISNMLGHYEIQNFSGMMRAEFQVDGTLIFIDFPKDEEHLLDIYLSKVNKRFLQDYSDKSLILERAEKSLRNTFPEIDEMIELYEGYNNVSFSNQIFALLDIHYKAGTIEQFADFHCATTAQGFTEVSFHDECLEVVIDSEYNLILNIPEHFYLSFRKEEGIIFEL